MQVQTLAIGVKLSPMFRDEHPPSSVEDEYPKSMQNLFFQLFKVEARIKISVYNGAIDIERLDNLLDQLEIDLTKYLWIL